MTKWLVFGLLGLVTLVTDPPISSGALDSTIFVDGVKYQCTAAGIQAALDTGGKNAHIILPPQTCAISVESNPLFAYDGSWIQGSGKFSTVIQRANGGRANNSIFVVQNGGGYGVIGNVRFSDFTIDGNQSNQTGGSDTIQGGAVSQFTVQNMRLINSWNNGIGLFTGGTSTASDILIENSDFEANATRAGCGAGQCADIRIAQPLRVRILNNRSDSSQGLALFQSNVGVGTVDIAHNIVNACLGYGIALGGGTPGATGVRIIGNTLNCPNGTANPVDLAAWDDLQVIGNEVWAGPTTGLGIDDLPPALRVGVTANRIHGNPAGPITGACISLGGSDDTITANLCDNSSGAGICLCVGASSQTHGVTIIGNIVKNGSRASSGAKAGIEAFIAPGGAGSLSGVVISGNRAYDDQGSPTQGWGIGLAVAGQTTGYSDITIKGNDVRGNKTAGMFNGTSGATGMLIVENPGGISLTVGTLPAAASSAGLWMPVGDSTAVRAEGQTCVGGSSNPAWAFSNGSLWKCF